MVRSKIMNSFNELMWSPNPPRPPGGHDDWSRARQALRRGELHGCPPAILIQGEQSVYDMLSWMDENRRSLIIYGLMIPIPYMLLCVTVRVLMVSVVPPPLARFPSSHLWAARGGMLTVDGIITSILTGKAVHSIGGVGVILIPLFIAIQLLVA